MWVRSLKSIMPYCHYEMFAQNESQNMVGLRVVFELKSLLSKQLQEKMLFESSK